MYSMLVRLVLILISVLLGAVELARGDVAVSVLPFAAAAMLVWGHYRYGPVWLAFRKLRAGQAEKATHLLSQVRKPALLASQARAYYEWIKACLVLADGDLGTAESHLREALSHRLRTSNDRSTMEAQLADVMLRKGHRKEAEALIAQAKARKHKAEAARMLADVERSLEQAT